MSDNNERVNQLGVHAAQTAQQLRDLAERMDELSWRPDGHTPDGLRELATALRGMAIRTALHTGDTDRLAALTGRTVRELAPADVLL